MKIQRLRSSAVAEVAAKALPVALILGLTLNRGHQNLDSACVSSKTSSSDFAAQYYAGKTKS